MQQSQLAAFPRSGRSWSLHGIHFPGLTKLGVAPSTLHPPVVTTSPQIDITFPPGVKLLPSLKNGFVVRGTTTAAATISATVSISKATSKKLKLGGKALVVASATGRFGAGGFSLEFKPAKRLRAKLGRAKRLPLRLAGTAVGEGGTTSFARTITLKR